MTHLRLVHDHDPERPEPLWQGLVAWGIVIAYLTGIWSGIAAIIWWVVRR